MPSRTRSSGRSRVTSLPSNVTVPPVVGSTPMTVLSRVVLPTPLRPITHIRRPSPTSRETPKSTRALPYPASSPSTDSILGPLTRSSQVDLLHPGIRADLLHRPLHQHLALVEDGDLRGVAPQEVHVVLD